MSDARDPFERRLAESFRSLGLTESAAAVAARGRDPRPPEDAFDAQVDVFRSLGMSEAAAKVAAIGRDHRSEHEAREALGEAPAGALSPEEHRRVIESAQFKRYTQLRESGLGPWEAAEQATTEAARTRFKQAVGRARLSGSACSCGVVYAAAQCPRCGGGR